MYELVGVGKDSYYVQSPAKIGLFRWAETKVCLIDSGNDKDAGRKVRQLLEEKGWELTAIYNTHSNADHIGGNQYLQKQTGCRIFAPRIEMDFTNAPVLEPSFLYGGFPPKDLRHKFLMAKESRAELLTDQTLPEGMEQIPLPGHFFEMVGFRTRDQVVYLADCLASRENLEKYPISFLYDVQAYLDTLDQVAKMEADMFVPAHAPATEEIASLARLNQEQVWRVAEIIAELCREPVVFETLLQKLFVRFGLEMDFQQYVLVGSTVRSYLAWLRDRHGMEIIFDEGRMLWRSGAPLR